MAARRIIWSHRAKSDLITILDFYFFINGNKNYSKKRNTSIRASINLLSKFPNLGIPTDVPDVRSLIFAVYNIFYTVHAKQT